MGRRKGSLNKKAQPIQLDFEVKKDFDEKTEVCMTTETAVATIPAEINQSEEEIEILRQELDQARLELEQTKLEIESKKLELKSMPIADAKSTASPAIINKDVALSDKVSEQKARDSVLVTGKFYNLRVPGQSVKLPYVKYGDEPVKWHPFSHGQVYTIPKGFADQINGGSESDPCYYMPKFIKNEGSIINPDDPGTGIHSVDTTNKKYSFLPLGFS